MVKVCVVCGEEFHYEPNKGGRKKCRPCANKVGYVNKTDLETRVIRSKYFGGIEVLNNVLGKTMCGGEGTD